ncbi:MAG: SMC family ATPase, partial [Anaerolineales bacterium]|nr:SMC family ATPase [Anaerolineales bacterium]
TLEADLLTAQQRQAEAKAENPRLKAEMDDLKRRIDQLEETEGADCPVCGGPLNPEERHKLIEDLKVEGKELGDKYRANQTLLAESGQLVRELERQIGTLSQGETDVLAQTRTVDRHTARLEQIKGLQADWETGDAPRLAEIREQLEKGSFAPEAHKRLAEIDAELKEIGYDAVAHDAARRTEMDARAAESELRDLEKAQAALAPIERELNDLESQSEAQKAALDKQQDEYAQATEALAEAEAQAPDLRSAEKDLMAAREQENRLRMEVGAAQQKVDVLKDLKTRRKTLETRREELSGQVGQFKQLERAFGKDGVPALLIEQALPQIEAKANEVLDRLSDGNMSVRFITQAAYKDKRRDDLRETLDIQISDSAGTRDYEMFSGGEAFRVNFAIRLALSEVLAQRAGARLQTLVIDEGFGSQDTRGRQRLIEAINLVSQDFAKILVITHIDELKDAFPTRIEVEKSEQGSVLSVI